MVISPSKAERALPELVDDGVISDKTGAIGAAGAGGAIGTEDEVAAFDITGATGTGERCTLPVNQKSLSAKGGACGTFTVGATKEDDVMAGATGTVGPTDATAPPGATTGVALVVGGATPFSAAICWERAATSDASSLILAASAADEVGEGVGAGGGVGVDADPALLNPDMSAARLLTADGALVRSVDGAVGDASSKIVAGC